MAEIAAAAAMNVQLRSDPPCDGAWNMAVDEHMLDRAAAEGRATLRFYRWSEPTLSLGYFQRAADRAAHAASRDCPPVRRSSGGGAIVHDRELTYSLALPTTHPRAADTGSLYRAVHGALIDALAEFGIGAKLHDSAFGDDVKPEPFLCFLRRAAGDVVVGDCKICGSAQRRRRGAILQHGSVLVECSPRAPELPGLRELVPTPIDFDALQSAWLKQLRGGGLGCEPSPTSEPWSPEELTQIGRFVWETFADPAWTNRR